MVPEVDKKDTYVLLGDVRTQIETTRQQILELELEALSGEKEALRQLAGRSFQQARQWTGKMLGELGITSHPYPNSTDASTDAIDPTTVTTDPSRPSGDGLSVIQRIKAARAHVKELDATLEELTARLIPGSRFNQFLFKAQEHALQAGMWLGELLAEHVDLAQPKAGAVAPEKDLSGSTTPSSTPTESSFTGSDTPTASSSSSTESEAVASKNELSPSTSLPTEEPSTATTTSGSGSEPSSPSASGSSGSEPALREVEGASEALTAAAEAETSADSVREL